MAKNIEQLETEIRIEHISLKTGKENSDGALAFSEYRSVSEEKTFLIRYTFLGSL